MRRFYMKIKEVAINELGELTPRDLFKVYDFMVSIRDKKNNQLIRRHPSAYIRVRQILKECRGSLSNDILLNREDRI